MNTTNKLTEINNLILSFYDIHINLYCLDSDTNGITHFSKYPNLIKVDGEAKLNFPYIKLGFWHSISEGSSPIIFLYIQKKWEIKSPFEALRIKDYLLLKKLSNFKKPIYIKKINLKLSYEI